MVGAMLGFVLLVKGHPGLKSPKECLCHVLLACWYLGGLYHTFRPIGHLSGPKNELIYAQTKQIWLCPH